MAAETVQADYEVLSQVAQKFAEQSGQIQEMIQRIQSSFEPLQGGGWKGMGSEAFFNEMDSEVFPATSRLQVALESASTTTNQIVETLSSAEQESANQFQIR